MDRNKSEINCNRNYNMKVKLGRICTKKLRKDKRKKKLL